MKTTDLVKKLISEDKLNEAIDLALTAPFPQLAVHHLIDKIVENLNDQILELNEQIESSNV